MSVPLCPPSEKGRSEVLVCNHFRQGSHDYVVPFENLTQNEVLVQEDLVTFWKILGFKEGKGPEYVGPSK